MKHTNTIIAFLLGLLALTACHKDKEMDVKDAVVSNEEMTVTGTQARFSWSVDFVGKFQTGVEISQNENMAEARLVETTKEEDRFVAVVDSLLMGTKYYYRIVVWNKFGDFGQPVGDFTTSMSYTILVSAEPSDGGTTAGGGTYAEGDTCTVKATANEGYAFVNWTKDGTEVSTNPVFTFVVTETATYVANFQVQSYTITASANTPNGGTVEGGGTYEYGQSCTVIATEANGYHFVNWTENGEQVSFDETYTFTVTGNRDLVANFTSHDYIIHVDIDPENAGTVTGNHGYNYGEECTLKAIPAEGFSFVKWTVGGNEILDNPCTFHVTESRYFVAHFQAINYQISILAEPVEGGTVTGGGNGFHHGDECTVTATANTNYVFDNWTENGNIVSEEANYTFQVSHDRTLVANFTHTYTIEVLANPPEGGTAIGGGTYSQGDTCTVVATANDGYQFDNWTENGNVVQGAGANYHFPVTGDHTLVAEFSVLPPNTYNINVSANPTDGGAVTGGGTYQQGQSCTVSATANNGFTFTNWTESGNVVSTQTNYTFTVTGNRTLVANFTRQYTINVSANPSNGGTVTGGGTYNEGQECTVYANPNSNYTFSNWTENGSVISTQANYTFSVTDNRTLVANFTPTYIITVSASPSNGGTVSGGGTYEEGQSCTVIANHATDYVFTNWTENGNVVSTNTHYSFYVTSDRNLEASFIYSSGGNAPQGAIIGLFTIDSNGNQVYFSKGNLQYNKTTQVWSFMEHQYDRVETEGQIVGENYANQNIISLFGWGTSGYHDPIDPYNVNYQPWSTSTTTVNITYNKFGYGPSLNMSSPDLTGGSANYDWGVYNFINNTTGQWRTLTMSEWSYIFNTRTTTTGIRYAKARITSTNNGTVNGMILFPDDWNINTYSPNNYNQNEADFSSNSISASQWLSFEQAGAVFLPAAGFRNGTSVINVGSFGRYWSTQRFNSSNAYPVHFDPSNLYTYYNYYRYYGFSVRLVCPAQ